MLLYTRVAPPKAPKRRSRSGCTFCKEKKKKCDEARPQCARCAERGQDCVYEAVKPRQRKKRDSSAGLGNDTTQTSGRIFRPSEGGVKHWRDFDRESKDHSDDSNAEELEITSPLESAFDTASLFAYAAADVPLISPVDSVAFDLSLHGNHGGMAEAEEEEEEAVALVRRHSAPEVGPVARSQPHHNDLAMVTTAPAGPPPRLEFLIPAFAEFSDRPNRRALVDHFCNVLSHLIVFREESGNPFQQLVLPLCHKSSAVMNATYALASAHLEYRDCGNAEKSVFFHNQAIQGLARLIEMGGNVDKNELLAAIMLLVYYEVLVQRGRSNIVDGHLKGAMTIMNTHKESSDPTGIFLERAFRFYDVIAALSFGTAPLSSTPAAGGLLPFPPLDAPPASPLCNVDTLLGMATTLWPIIHRLSNLLAMKSEIEQAANSGELGKVAVLRTEFETTADAIEVALKQWQPCLPPGFTINGKEGEQADMAAERARLQSILNNALAYRHSAFVYLYRTIHGYPRRHALVQRHAHVSLTHCVATVSHAGPMGALLWPLFVAACEAVSLGDRDLARQAFVCVDRRQGMTNISRAWLIVQEVWRRADVIDENTLEVEGFTRDMGFSTNGKARRPENGADLWRRVSEDMGVTIVFG